MIEDLEPFPDQPEVGDVFEPTTYWTDTAPDELVTEVAARIEKVTADDRIERLADLGDGFTTIVPSYIDAAGETVLSGCLMWDRYLWIDYHTQPTGRVQLIERVPLFQHVVRTPTQYPNWYSVTYDGPQSLRPGHTHLDDYQVAAYALRVRTLPLPP
ncbi:hypothetical protein [Prescottella sp. R16]|uniref:hypothetical protein n=1 Tax=Prescottella sp. R16 TaxID=3064529 RepID=UPI00272E705B|nr:hypothetical protein [Prescottella sp. R16]